MNTKLLILSSIYLITFFGLSNLQAQTIDPSFAPSFTTGSYAQKVVAQPDGKILVVGGFSSVNNQASRSFVRINSDGTLDGTFNFDIDINSEPTALALQSDGKIIIGGSFENKAGDFIGSILRLNPDGSLDDSFSKVRDAGLTYLEFEILSNQKIFARYFRCVENVQVNCNVYGIKIFQSDGLPDDNFPALEFEFDQNSSITSSISDIDLQSDNALIVAGSRLKTGGFVQDVFRFDSLGVIDTNFNPEVPTISNIVVKGVDVLKDGTIGILSGVGHYVVLLDSVGSQILSRRISLPRTGDGFSDGIIKSYTENSFLILSRNAAAIVRTDGLISTDPNFKPLDSRFILDYALSNEAIFIVGTFNGILSSSLSGIAKTNRPDQISQFTSDQTFQTQLNEPGRINSILVQDDGKIIVGGDFDLVNGTQTKNLVRLDGTGDIDHSFNSVSRLNPGIIRGIKQLSDGAYLIVGLGTGLYHFNKDSQLVNVYNQFNEFFNSYENYTHLEVDQVDNVYVAAGGAYFSGSDSDQSFLQYDFSNQAQVEYENYNELYMESLRQIYGFKSLSTNNLIVHGYELKYDGSDTTAIIRIKEDGRLDRSFNTDLPRDFIANSLHYSSNSTMLVAGGRILSGKWIGGFYKLDESGRILLDFSDQFRKDGNVDFSIENILELSNERFLVQGFFDEYDGRAVNSGQVIIDGDGNQLGHLIDEEFVGSFDVLENIDDSEYYIGGQFSNPNGGSSLLRFLNQEREICESADIILANQNQVDRFNLNYPNCESISSLTIAGDITNLDSLIYLNTVTQSLKIEATSLSDLEGLEHIDFNQAVNFQFIDNTELLDIVNISYRADVDSLIIVGNSSLLQVSNPGFSTYIKYILIDENESLVGVPIFDMLWGADKVEIINNPRLEECCGLFDLIDRAEIGSLQLENNGENCSNEQNILEQCGFCFDQNITLNSQQDVDNFRVNFPACTDLTSLRIEGEEITNLDSLYYLQYLQPQDLSVENTSLTNLDGLSHVSISVDYVEIINNPLLESINLPNLDVRDDVRIIDNASLINLDGLSNIDHAGFVEIAGNSSLQDLNGLSQLDVRYDIFITDNVSLVDISGLESALNHGLDGFVLHGNSSLSDCCILEEYFTFEHPHEEIDFEISANAPSCDNKENIISNCSGEICQIEELILTTQDEVDSFPSNFPNCHSLTALSIEGEGITNVDSLYPIRSVETTISIKNTSIEYLTGLTQVEQAADLVIENNSELKTIRGFEGISSLNETLTIRNNDAIQDLSGVNFFQTIGGVIIDDNDLLTQIDDFNDLQVVRQFMITNNSSLSECCIVEQLLSLGLEERHITIVNNADRCNSYEDARTSCNINTPCEIIDATFSSQEEVDSFEANHPNCTEIRNIYVDGNDVSSLVSLSFIQNIYGDVAIQNTSLTSLEGLNVNRAISAIHIGGNPLLTNISALNNVGATELRIIINDNNSLEDLDALSNLTFAGDAISIYNNLALVSVDGLGNVESPYGFFIVDNSSLNECCFLAQKIQDGYDTSLITLSGNAGGCMSLGDLTSNCNDDDEANNGNDGRGPCDASKIYLRSQTDVDNFEQDYPNCGEVNELIITGLDIENLDGLATIVEITRRLKIDETSLVDLSGLQHIDISGLSHLEVFSNQLLTNLIGLNIQEEVDKVIVSENPLLSNIQNLEPLRIYEYLEVFGNTSLSECCSILNSLEHEEGRMVIRRNDTGCNGAREIQEKCNETQNVDCTEVILFSQDDVDNFQDQYPGCTSTDILHIDGIDIDNLDGIAALREVTREIYVGSTQLVKLSGLDAIRFENLEIVNFFDNNLLEDLVGFNLSGQVQDMNIDENNSLLDLSGLEALTSANHLSVSFNNSIVSLRGLEGLRTIEGMIVTENSQLSDISALSGITDITFGDFFQNNSLADCCVLLPFMMEANTGIAVGDNAPGCNRDEEINVDCSEVREEISCMQELIFLGSQQDVDDFIQNYDCNVVNALEINGEEITNLNGISHLVRVEDYLKITNTNLQRVRELADVDFETISYLILNRNSKLENFRGLDCGQNLKHCKISSNEVLLDLAGLQNLRRADFLSIEKNDNLRNLAGLENLSYANRFTITNNAVLSNFSGLEQLETVETLSIYFNPSLVEIDALSTLKNFELMHVNFNAQLNECCGLLSAIRSKSENDFLNINNNLPGCNSEQEVLDECSTAGIVRKHDKTDPIDQEQIIKALSTLGSQIPRTINKYSIYPNPFGNKITIRNIDKLQSSQVVLYDIHGKLLQTKSMNGEELILETETLSAGIYIIRIEGNDNVQTLKVIKS